MIAIFMIVPQKEIWLLFYKIIKVRPNQKAIVDKKKDDAYSKVLAQMASNGINKAREFLFKNRGKSKKIDGYIEFMKDKYKNIKGLINISDIYSYEKFNDIVDNNFSSLRPLSPFKLSEILNQKFSHVNNFIENKNLPENIKEHLKRIIQTKTPTEITNLFLENSKGYQKQKVKKCKSPLKYMKESANSFLINHKIQVHDRHSRNSSMMTKNSYRNNIKGQSFYMTDYFKYSESIKIKKFHIKSIKSFNETNTSLFTIDNLRKSIIKMK